MNERPSATQLDRTRRARPGRRGRPPRRDRATVGQLLDRVGSCSGRTGARTPTASTTPRTTSWMARRALVVDGGEAVAGVLLGEHDPAQVLDDGGPADDVVAFGIGVPGGAGSACRSPRGSPRCRLCEPRPPASSNAASSAELTHLGVVDQHAVARRRPPRWSRRSSRGSAVRRAPSRRGSRSPRPADCRRRRAPAAAITHSMPPSRSIGDVTTGWPDTAAANQSVPVGSTVLVWLAASTSPVEIGEHDQLEVVVDRLQPGQQTDPRRRQSIAAGLVGEHRQAVLRSATQSSTRSATARARLSLLTCDASVRLADDRVVNNKRQHHHDRQRHQQHPGHQTGRRSGRRPRRSSRPTVSAMSVPVLGCGGGGVEVAGEVGEVAGGAGDLLGGDRRPGGWRR